MEQPSSGLSFDQRKRVRHAIAGVLRRFTGRGADSIDVRLNHGSLVIECRDCMTDYEARVLNFVQDKQRAKELIEILRRELFEAASEQILGELDGIIPVETETLEVVFSPDDGVLQLRVNVNQC